MRPGESWSWGAETWTRALDHTVWREGPCTACGQGRVRHPVPAFAGWCAACAARSVAAVARQTLDVSWGARR